MLGDRIVEGVPLRTITLRSRVSDDTEVHLERQDWRPSRTAVIICDMWNATQCVSAQRRVVQLSSRINEVAASLRNDGALVIHAPGGCMDYYAGTRARQRAQEATPVPSAVPIGWHGWDASREARLPRELGNDTPCSCEPGPPCTTGGPPYPWTHQIDAIEISPADAVSDDGHEILALLEAREAEDVVVMGVHTNRCVLGRPYGIRQLVYWNKRPVLCRDLTDSYHRHPEGHLVGNELMISHVERYWCPTVTSDQLAGGSPLQLESGS